MNKKKTSATTPVEGSEQAMDWLAAHLHSIEEQQFSGSIPDGLQKVREILRLAKAIKAEAEQLREEAEMELGMARRERHDAEILKKNATEILRMAKEKLANAS